MQSKHAREALVRESKITLILDAAREVFIKTGFSASRLEDIAEAAGFSKTALYYYFKDKEEIFLNLCIRDLDSMASLIEQKKNLALRFKEILSEIITAIIYSFNKQFSLLQAIANYHSSEFPNLSGFSKYKKEIEILKKGNMLFDRAFEEILENAQKKGEIDPSVNTLLTATYISSLVRGVIVRWHHAGIKLNLEEEINNLLAFLTPTLKIKE